MDIKYRKPEFITDTGINGGYISSEYYPNNSINSMFPDLSVQDLAIAEITQYRKVFAINEDVDNLVTPRMRIYLNIMRGYESVAGVLTEIADDTICYLMESTQTETFADLDVNGKKYGAGLLSTPATSGTNTLVVTFKSSLALVATGDTIAVITNNGTHNYIVQNAVWAGNVCTITTESQLAANYTTGLTVAACILVENMQPTVENLVVTSNGGSFDDVNFPILLNNKSTIKQIWTLEFTSATTYTVTGNKLGVIGSGVITASFQVNNEAFGLPYLYIQPESFLGTLQAGDLIVFETNPNAAPVWVVVKTPQNTTAKSLEITTLTAGA